MLVSRMFAGVLYFVLVLNLSKAMETVDYSSKNIADDRIALAIKTPRPIAIQQEILNNELKKTNLQNVEILNFSSNFITSIGASNIVDFIYENKQQFNKLTLLNLSFNRIGSGDVTFSSFTDGLLKLHEYFKSLEVKLGGNYISIKAIPVTLSEFVDLTIE